MLATGVKNGCMCLMGSNFPAPTWKDPDPLLGRQTPTSSSPPHSPKVGVHGKPLLQLVVLVICQPPMRASSSRPALPANLFPLPNGNSYTTLVTQTWLRV